MSVVIDRLLYVYVTSLFLNEIPRRLWLLYTFEITCKSVILSYVER